MRDACWPFALTRLQRAVNARPSISRVNIAARAGSPRAAATSAIRLVVDMGAPYVATRHRTFRAVSASMQVEASCFRSWLWGIANPAAEEHAMITCVIRYQIDPTKKPEFERYARTWGASHPALRS